MYELNKIFLEPDLSPNAEKNTVILDMIETCFEQPFVSAAETAEMAYYDALGRYVISEMTKDNEDTMFLDCY